MYSSCRVPAGADPMICRLWPLLLLLAACSAPDADSGPPGKLPRDGDADTDTDTDADTDSGSTPATWMADGDIELLLVPAGSFTMDADDTYHRHDVTLTHDLYVGRTEVTQAQWQAIAGDAPSYHSGCAACPVEDVTWDEAVGLANLLSDAEGRDRCYTGAAGARTPVADVYGCDGYRLLTEAEWEFAAQGGEPWNWAGSDDPDAVAWTDRNADGETHPVCELQVNGYGLCDMSGNVYEWVEDWYGSVYYDSSPAVDPPGPETGTMRVARGGAWYYDASAAGVANRYRYNVGDTEHHSYLGVRIGRAVQR